MEHYKISKLLDGLTVWNFLKGKWIKVNDLSGNKYSAKKNSRFKTRMLSSNLCYYSDAHIVEKGTVDLLNAATNENYKAEKDVAFEN